jgi:hypothetical protein
MAERHEAAWEKSSDGARSTTPQRLNLRLFALLFVMATLTVLPNGCQVLPRSLEGRSQPERALVTELHDVPFHPDDTTLCGPSALASVLQFAGAEVSVADLTRDVYLPERKGSLQIEMLNAARRRNQLAYLLSPDTDAIQLALENRFPVLVFVNLGLDFSPSWHYAVVVGAQSTENGQRAFVVRSGLERRQIFTEDLFRRVWARGKYWAMIVSRPTDLPLFLSPQTLLDGILALSPTESAATRQTALEAAHKALPTEPKVTFALASELQRNGETIRAELFWKTLAGQENQAAAAANLADLLNKQGRTTEAVRWACKAQMHLSTQNLSDAIRQRILVETNRIIAAGNAQCEG